VARLPVAGAPMSASGGAESVSLNLQASVSPQSPASRTPFVNTGVRSRGAAPPSSTALAPPPPAPLHGCTRGGRRAWFALLLLVCLFFLAQLRREAPNNKPLRLVEAIASPTPPPPLQIGAGAAMVADAEAAAAPPGVDASGMEAEVEEHIQGGGQATVSAVASSSHFASSSVSASGSTSPSASLAGTFFCVLLGQGSRFMRRHATGVAPLVLAPINHLHVQTAYHTFLRGLAAADVSNTPANAPPAASGRYQFPRLYNNASLWLCNVTSLKEAANMHAAEPFDVYSAIIVSADEFNPASRKFDLRPRHHFKCVARTLF
jgi:hypothetical protein